MPWIIYIYWMFGLVIIITVYTNTGWQAALSALAGVGFAFLAGAGLKGSLYGTKAQKLAGLALAVVMISLAHWIGQGFSVHVFGYDLTGTEWVWIGFAICLLFTPKRFALERE